MLLLLSPRTPAGLLTWPAWQALTGAAQVLAADLDPAWLQALAEAGVAVRDVAELPVPERAGLLVTLAGAAVVVWFGSPDGDPGLTDALADQLSQQAVAGAPPELEVLTGAFDLPGARLLDLVAVMDTLRSPGGCPWDAEQTHTSLLPYLLEETHEVVEAVESGDREHLVEELGDLLLQVVFHARVAQEDTQTPFDIDEVAGGIVAKLIRRHPHVFDAAPAGPAQRVAADWEDLKAAEKPGRGTYDGIPATLPALARAQKMLARLERAGTDPQQAAGDAAGQDPVRQALLAAVLAARAAGVDAEATLRAALRSLPGA